MRLPIMLSLSSASLHSRPVRRATRVSKARPDPRARPARKAFPALWARQARPDPVGPQVSPARQDRWDPRGLRERLDRRAKPGPLARRVAQGTGPQGEAGPAGQAPAGAPGRKGRGGGRSCKPTFTLRRFQGEGGKAAAGQCEAGEQLIAATCSTGATISDDGSSATCTAPSDPNAASQLTITCAK